MSLHLLPLLTGAHRRPSMLALALLVGSTSACRARGQQQPESRAPEPAPVTTLARALTEPQVPPGNRAQFFAPTGLVAFSEILRLDTDQTQFDYLLMADTLNHTIRRIEISTGLATTFAGTAGVEGSSGSLFRRPAAVAIAGAPPQVFVADRGNHTIRHIYVDTDTNQQVVATLAGTAGQRGYGATLFDNPAGVAIGEISDGSHGASFVDSVFVADTDNAVIRKVSLANGQVTLVAGVPGQHGHADAEVGTAAKFNRPTGLVYNRYIGKLYVADTGNHVIRVIELAAGASRVTTLAGAPGAYGHQDGHVTSQARFAQPVAVAFKEVGASLLVTDRASYAIREIDVRPNIADPQVTTVAGVAWERGHLGGGRAAARFRAPSGVAHLAGKTYVADTGNNLVRAIVPSGADVAVSTLVGRRTAGALDGWPEAFTIGQPRTIACDGNRLVIDGVGVQIVDLDPDLAGGAVRVVASSAWTGFVHLGNAVYQRLAYNVERLDLVTGVRTFFSSVDNSDNDSVDVIAAAGTALLTEFTASFDNTHNVLRFPVVNGVPGNRQGLPGILLGAVPAWDGTHLYSRVAGGLQKFDPHQAAPAPTVISAPALGTDVLDALAVTDGFAYFTTAQRHDVRKLDLATGAVSTLAGSAGTADGPFEDPNGLCASGNHLFVTDTGNGQIRRVDRATGASIALALRRAQ